MRSISTTTLSILLLISIGSEARAQDHPVFDRIIRTAETEHWEELPLGRIMQATGEMLLGSPYVAGLLDATENEQLIAPLDRFDCVLFVESVLAVARIIKQGLVEYPDYLAEISRMRYRDGQMNGYCSRLHYFTDWIADNERRGLVIDISSELGGIPLAQQLSFMGTHRTAYPQIASNDSLFQGILQMEARLGNLQSFYIPQDSIRNRYALLKAGDIVATATRIDGLDVTHTGLVYDSGDGRKGLLHASLSAGVTVSPDLQSYVENNSVQIGIVVARPREISVEKRH